MGRSLRRMRVLVFAGFALAACGTALAGQFDRPSQLAPATVSLRSGKDVHGLFVASDGSTVTLGVAHNLRSISRTEIASVSIGQPPDVPLPHSLERDLFNAIF